MRVRTERASNYRGFYCRGRTLRTALEPGKPITKLEHPEFYDIKITSHCDGNCPWCYMDSRDTEPHDPDVVPKIRRFFGAMPLDQRPFQVAVGGGEPTSHPHFIAVLHTFRDLGITPNYTTNGMWATGPAVESDRLLRASKLYCGGVAVSCHPHLRSRWEPAAAQCLDCDIPLNFHLIISDAASCDTFLEIYAAWRGRIDNFVLLPYRSLGRAPPKDVDWDYLANVLPAEFTDIAFGAEFHRQLAASENRWGVSLYEPEAMSAFLDLDDMQVYRSSFDRVPR